MTSNIADLWNGRINASAMCAVDDPKANELLDKLYDLQNELDDLFTKEQKELFDKYDRTVEQYYSFFTERAFCDGFSLGIKLLVESLSSDE